MDSNQTGFNPIDEPNLDLPKPGFMENQKPRKKEKKTTTDMEVSSMDLEHQTMEMFLRWASELGISDSIDSSRLRDSCLGRSLSVADFPLAGGCV